MDSTEIILQALDSMILQFASLLPKLIVALLIWYVGKYLLGLALVFVKKIDLKKTQVDEEAMGMITTLVDIIGRVVLALVVLDYLGIGRTIIGALTQGVTFAIAIALGLAFGKALEDDARKVVESVKRLFKE
ncbi:hypothetical protein A2803_04920 [Candidatus Woesebacteria bacterium RIFCSPHIGHO2_01_FULL_44_21]|uniref:Mechanosensitive ion channel n=1 Tax=Candidatus Woesebacteria bacterium RIFCSPHIGHO2_01_FULL_44_21 TaxID=1802503 RepID=A0A1F7Z3J5_9BACT|nr:MAG: hypothetical protein A2803_04920 [Candidatus Woesebacteria bacterium RIFCSPHIGHO2_01_FULL_44_21]OGM69459.1 MAG: hypothetical protein A2897_03850 [Candidatus Woesebacteria bacterium RIFCSPLOWO2_01_FULL_44_24b]